MNGLRNPTFVASVLRRWANVLWSHDTIRAALFLLCAVALLYSPVVFLGRSLQAPLYYPLGIGENGPYGYNGRKPTNVFDVDLATPAYYEWPINLLVGRAYRQGELPLWNPYQAAGTPLAAQYSTRAFFPYQVLLDLSPVSTWDFFFLGRLWIAGLFTFLFLRGLGVSWTSGVLGAFCYMFSGTFVWFINLEEFVNTAMVAPVLLWSIAGLWRWGWQRGSVAIAVAVALVLLAGQPETALFVLILGTSYGAFRLGHSELQDRARILRAGLAAMVLGFLLATPLLLPFLDFERSSFNNHPPGGTMGVQDPAQPLDALSILIPTFYQRETFYRFLPDNGRWDWLGGYLGIVPVYLTLLGAVLVFVQKHSRWRQHLLFFSIFGLLVLLKNFGFPLVAWVGRLPLLDQAWSPRWAGPSWTLSFAIAAAFGLECLHDQARGAEANQWVRRWGGSVWPGIRRDLFGMLRQPLLYFYVSLCFAFVALVGTPWIGDQVARSNGIVRETLKDHYFLSSVILGIVVALIMLASCVFISRAHLLDKIPLSTFSGLVLLELGFAIPWGYRPESQLLRIFIVLAGLGTIFDLTRHRLQWTALGSMTALVFALAIDGTAQQGPPQRYNPAMLPPFVEFLRTRDGYYRVTGGDRVLMPNFASLAGVQDVRYINSLVEESYYHFRSKNLHREELWSKESALWFTGSPQLDVDREGHPARISIDFAEDFWAKLRFYSFLSVKYLITPRTYRLTYESSVRNIPPNGDSSKWSRALTAESSPPIAYDREVRIYENRDALPRAFVVYGATSRPTLADAQDALREPGFDFRHVAVLETPVPAWYQTLAGSAVSTSLDSSPASIVHYGLNRVSVQAESPTAGILVLTDVFAPGWIAYVDGRPREVFRVDGLVRGVYLPAGKHLVVLCYAPRSLAVGLVLASVATLSCSGLLALSFTNSRRGFVARCRRAHSRFRERRLVKPAR